MTPTSFDLLSVDLFFFNVSKEGYVKEVYATTGGKREPQGSLRLYFISDIYYLGEIAFAFFKLNENQGIIS